VSEAVVYLNGRFVTAGRAAISPLDRGFLYGDGLFETMRAYQGRVFRLHAHLQRMAASAAVLRLPHTLDVEAIGGIAQELLRRNGLSDGALRLTITRGPGDGVDLPPQAEPTILMTARRLARDSGLDSPADVLALPNSAPVPALARHKTLCYLPYVLARAQAKAAGADDALLLNAEGVVTEASTSNVFIVRGDHLATPRLECGLLPGITRGIVLDLAREAGLAPEEADLKLEDLRSTGECFLTNSVAEITPVRRLDGAVIGEGKFSVAKRLHAAYRALVAREVAA
jgi:branched-chain amino acid aminotransferase